MVYGIIKGIFVKLLVAACILMQLAVKLPHHHHNNTNVPCINIFHCTEDHADGCTHNERHECACGGHHSDSPDPAAGTHQHDPCSSHCALNLTDMLRIERERIDGPSELSIQLFAVQTVFMRTIHDADAATCLDTLTRLDRERPDARGAIFTAYITAAIPPRAPSVTV